MYEAKETRTALARQLAEEGAVLLKNDGILPLSKAQTLAVFGRACVAAQTGGAGSGASRGGAVVTLEEAAREAGLRCCPARARPAASWVRPWCSAMRIIPARPPAG